MKSKREKSAQATDAVKISTLEETRSFLDNLPQVKKPEPKRNTLDDHLAFLNSLPKAPAPAPEPLKEAAVGRVSLEGVREDPLDVHEGTESPNKGPQKNSSVPRPQKAEARLDGQQQAEEAAVESENAVHV